MVFIGMKIGVVALINTLLVSADTAAINIFVEESHATAWIRYECLGGEVVRAFALDVAVDNGRIVGIGDYFRGPCTAAAQGYGIFPASLRSQIGDATKATIDWQASAYSPLAAPEDSPGYTLPGLNSTGVTLEFGGLWDPNDVAAIPPRKGTLCSLRLTSRALVSIRANHFRGGIVPADPDATLDPVFTSAVVQPPEITGVTLTNGRWTVTFAGGFLEAASSPNGPWVNTGNSAGRHTEAVGAGQGRYFRICSP